MLLKGKLSHDDYHDDDKTWCRAWGGDAFCDPKIRAWHLTKTVFLWFLNLHTGDALKWYKVKSYLVINVTKWTYQKRWLCMKLEVCWRLWQEPKLCLNWSVPEKSSRMKLYKSWLYYNFCMNQRWVGREGEQAPFCECGCQGRSQSPSSVFKWKALGLWGPGPRIESWLSDILAVSLVNLGSLICWVKTELSLPGGCENSS